MKWSVLKNGFATLMCSLLIVPAYSQNYYLVVGAFATESDNIGKFTAYLPGQAMDTSYTLRNNNEVLHLYVLKTSNKNMAVSRATALQDHINSGNSSAIDEFNLQTHAPLYTTLSGENPIASAASETSGADTPASGGLPAKPKGKYFKFTISTSAGEVLPGKIHQIDFEQRKDVGSFEAGTYVDILHPQQQQPMAIVCGVFGYKEVQKYLDYSNPSFTEGAYRDENGAWIIPYRLERLQKGDVSVMYNVSFYNDAAVMRKESQKDLDALVSMMNDNPDYVIKIHAHCNSKSKREVMTPAHDGNYFDPDLTVPMKATAKELTNLRGEAVRNYLLDHGIDESRIKIYGWGGTEMLVDANSAYAQLNDRIEIEILKD